MQWVCFSDIYIIESVGFALGRKWGQKEIVPFKHFETSLKNSNDIT